LFARRRETKTFERVRSGLPLSPNEERYVLSEAISAEAYGNPWSVRIRGRLDEARMRDAIQRVCDRHEGRRTGFEASGDGHFTRYVEARGRPSVRWLQMPGAPADEVRRTIRAWFFERGDLSPPSFTKILVIQLADDEFVLANYFHHATSDAETHRAALVEIFDTYAGAAPEGEPVQYSDLWAWDWAAAPAYREAEAFWVDHLGGVDEIGALAEDGGDAGGATWTGPVDRRLSAELTQAAKQAAAEIGVSEFTFHYAVALVLLTRLAGQPRVCTTFQSRGRPKTGADGVHGVFSNSLILATEVDEAQSIADLAQRLRGEIRMALTHEAYPYHHVIKATGAHPRFGVNWFPELPVMRAPGLEIERPEMSYGNWEYDLNLRFVRYEAAGALDVVIYFREQAFRRERVAAAAEQYAALLAAFARDVRAPIGATASADLAPAGVLPDLSAALPSGGGELIQAAFLRRAAETPEADCVAYAGATYSYGDVEQRSRALAGELLAAGVKPGDRVAVVAERRPELVWTLLAVARLGGVFVVLDSAYPQARLATLIEIAAPRALVPAGGLEAIELARRLGRDASVQVVEPAGAEAGDISGLDAAAPTDPAYILFTSGSTGRPKGVACSHVPLSRFTAWQAEAFGLRASDRFSMLAGLSHDPLLRDIFTALGLGATVVIPDAHTVVEPGALARWFRKAGITVAHVTPALGQVLLAGAAKVRGLPDLRRLFWGGDLLPTDLTRDMARFAPNARQTNFYGATETPQAVAAFGDADKAGGRNVPIGRGVNGAQVLVLDARGRQAGVGEAGEIAVRSNYLSLGYVEAGRIVPPGDRGPDGKTYRTGDRGFHLPDGDVLIIGRADDQVKVRGHRVELAEVTAALKAQPRVGEAAALAVGEGAALRIFGFVSPSRDAPPREAELMAGLAVRLPAHMLPRAIRVLERLPLLPNGKVDRQALRVLALAGQPDPSRAHDADGANPTERALIARWSGVLGDHGISRATTFAGLGGDSLSYVQAYLATEEVIGVVPSGWQAMTIAELSAAKREASRFWSVVDTPMLVRAVSIVVIVMGHLGLLAYGGGATAGLMIVFGVLFGAFQLTETFGGGSAQPILRGLRRLLLPVMLFSAALFAVKTALGKAPDLSVLLLYGNLVDYSALSGPRWGGHEFYLWFIYCSIQMMALIWLAALAALRFGGTRVTAWRFALGMFALGCLGRFVAPALFIPDFLTQGAPSLTPVNYLPTTHLSTVMLGALIALAQTNHARLGVLVLLATYAGLTAPLYGPYGALVILAAGVLILALKRLPLPRPLTALVLTLSGASLFIYLTHFQFRGVLRLLGAPDLPALNVAVALVGGVAAWALWIRASAFMSRLLHRAPQAEPQAVL